MKKVFKVIGALLGLLIVALPVRFYMLGGESQAMKPNLGIENGRLKPCTSDLNCVISYKHEELKPHKTESNPINKLKVIFKQKNIKIESETVTYLKGIHTSSIFGFVDDIEFHYDSNAKLLHYRSASRVGKSDLGANKKRVLAILKEL